MAIDAPTSLPVTNGHTNGYTNGHTNGHTKPQKMSASAKTWRETPLIESANLSKAAGCRILLKLELLQPSGSFKSRGIGHLCSLSLARSANPQNVHFYSSSGGNAGLACVHAAKTLGRPSTVVVPLSTKAMMIAKIKAAGASEVIQEGCSWKEADLYMRETVMRRAEDRGEEAVYVPPFDHEDVWAGHQYMVCEISRQLGGEEPSVIACSAGGGGLFIGIAQGVEEVGWKDTQILAMETQGADALNVSLRAGELTTLPGITSQATSLGAVRVAERAYEIAKEGEASGRVVSAVLSDAEAAMGCWRFADDERMLVELACGVNLALCYGGRLEKALGRTVHKDETVVIVVCGGSNVNTEMLANWRLEHGHLEDEGVANGVVPSGKTAPNGA